MTPTSSARLSQRLGPGGILTDPADTDAYCEDWRRLYHGRTPAVLRPASTAEVADAVRLCAEARVPIVPMGGNTSMVGGAAVSEDGSQIVLSLSRLNRVRTIDPVDMTMEIEAGVTLKAAQLAAEEADCLLPLSISSEGSAQIGGVLATNAGGNNTVRYGNARDLVLGLEVVLPDGQVWNGLRRLHKDNTGYCLRQLFVGSEGTLGIITAAVLKLFPQPRELAVALCAVASPEAALQLFQACQHHDPAAIQAFEYMSGAGMALVERFIPDAKPPLSVPAAHYVLVELATPPVRRRLARGAGGIAGCGDGKRHRQRCRHRRKRAAAGRDLQGSLREEHSEAQKRAGASVKNDISVPVSSVPELIRRATEACERLVPGLRCVPFGHLGDGNIHFNLVQPDGADGAGFLARDHELMDAVNAIVRDLDGSFSAEHGIGRLKPYMIPDWRGGAELELMRRIKAALDPAGLFNPGKLLP